MSIINIDTHDVKCDNCAICIGRHIGEKDERSRIIKLLEDFDFSCIWRQIGWPNNYESFDAEELIALIKGENK